MKKIYASITFGKNKKTKGYLLDISRSGLSIASSAAIRKNALIKITPGSKRLVALNGKVLYWIKLGRKSYSYKLGVFFIHLNAAQKASLDRFISPLLARRSVVRLSFI